MRILLLTTLVPTDPPSGGTLATLELSRRLETYGEVQRWAVWGLGEGTAQHGMWQGARAITLAQLRRRGLARGVARGLPLTVARFHRREVATALSRLGRFDLFFADHLAMWQYSSLVDAERRVIYSHNVESEIYERAASRDPSVVARTIWRREARVMARYEGAALRAAQAVICPGIRDQASLATRYGIQVEAWYPPVGEVELVPARRSQGQVVASVGTMEWLPNRWGMDWFVHEVWPLIRQAVPQAQLRLGGRGSERLPYSNCPGVECFGPVWDLSAFFADVDVVVAPIRGGAGIKIKVMDAAARGLPAVTTSIGIEGFGAHVPRGIAVADQAHAFASSVLGFLRGRLDLPVEENVLWYQHLVRSGGRAIETAVLGYR